MELGVGVHEYSLTCQILIGWKHHAICWLVWRESACDAFLLIGRALGWWVWSARDHCMHFWRENAGELKIMKSTLFWQLRANYTQKECPTPQPVTLSLTKLLTVPVNTFPITGVTIEQDIQLQDLNFKIYFNCKALGLLCCLLCGLRSLTSVQHVDIQRLLWLLVSTCKIN